MTITNDERHEVAARLRENEHGLEYLTLVEILGFDRDAEPYFDGYHRKTECLVKDMRMRLADLVEPEPERTCHVVQTIRYDYDGYAGTEYVTELSCGHKYTDSYDGGPDYCPWCGARVIEE